MAFAFDTPGYARRLRDAGIPPNHVEAQAEAAREFIMAELVTKPNLAVLRGDFLAPREDFHALAKTWSRSVASISPRPANCARK